MKQLLNYNASLAGPFVDAVLASCLLFQRNYWNERKNEEYSDTPRFPISHKESRSQMGHKNNNSDDNRIGIHTAERRPRTSAFLSNRILITWFAWKSAFWTKQTILRCYFGMGSELFFWWLIQHDSNFILFSFISHFSSNWFDLCVCFCRWLDSIVIESVYCYIHLKCTPRNEFVVRSHIYILMT